MATMEAAAAAATVAATTTEVAHPMDEQAGPFPIEKLQVSAANGGGGGGAREGARACAGGVRAPRGARALPRPRPPILPAVNEASQWPDPAGSVVAPSKAGAAHWGALRNTMLSVAPPFRKTPAWGARPLLRALGRGLWCLSPLDQVLELIFSTWEGRRGRGAGGPARGARHRVCRFLFFASALERRRVVHAACARPRSSPTPFSLTLPPRPPSFLLPTPSLPGTGHRRGRHQEAQGGRHQHG